MPVEGLVILIVTLVALLAMGIWVIVMAVKGGRIPEGYRFEHKFAGNKAILVVEKDIQSLKDPNDDKKVTHFLVDGEKFSAQDLVEKCAIAMSATEAAFVEKNIKKADIDTCVFLFKTDHSFENPKIAPKWWGQWSKNVAAYSATTGATFGSGHPMAVIRSKYMKIVSERGQPSCHELIHILNKEADRGYQHDHSDPLLWVGHGTDTIEAKAVRNWHDMVKSLEDGE